jgi:WD40 repeat protein
VHVSEGQILRRPAAGGTSENVAAVHLAGVELRCTRLPYTVCIVSQAISPNTGGDETTFSVLDPVGGSLRPMLRLPQGISAWDLSPDGRRIFAVSPDRTHSRAFLAELDGSDRQQSIPLDPGITGASWMPDGKHLLLTRFSAGAYRLVVCDLAGHESPIWSSAYEIPGNPLVSPDGRRLAFSITTNESNVYSVSGF